MNDLRVPNGFALMIGSTRVRDLFHTVKSGCLGELCIATHKRSCPADDRVCRSAFDLAICDVAIFRRLLGKPLHVMATLARNADSEFLTATLAFESGALGSIVSHWGYPGSPKFSFDYAGKNGNLIHDGHDGIVFSGVQKTNFEEACCDYSPEEWAEDLKIIDLIERSARAFAPQEAS